MTDDLKTLTADLVQVSRLGLKGDDDELRLLLARLVRRYRSRLPELAKEISANLDTLPAPSIAKSRVERHELDHPSESSTLAILRTWDPATSVEQPVFESHVEAQLDALVQERLRADELVAHGLRPVSSAIFVGPPGVGKTHTAKWLSRRLQMPLFSLDLTAVMNSRLGQSGANLRYALDFAKAQPSILFLDEIDSIAKDRADQSDVGELKRLVTIMLQELDDWPSTSLLLAATNHPRLVDSALWRRFDAEISFPMPSEALIQDAIQRFLASDLPAFLPYVPALARLFDGKSFSDVERSIEAMRKSVALGNGTPADLVSNFVQVGVDGMTQTERIGLAVELSDQTDLSQHQIARMTTVSRDTIRKHTKATSEGQPK